jgi:hypothetical protein
MAPHINTELSYSNKNPATSASSRSQLNPICNATLFFRGKLPAIHALTNVKASEENTKCNAWPYSWGWHKAKCMGSYHVDAETNMTSVLKAGETSIRGREEGKGQL